MRTQVDNRGESLVEVILAIAVLAIGGFAVIDLTFQAFHATRVGAEHQVAAAYASAGIEAAASIAKTNWADLTLGSHGISDASGFWAFQGSADASGKYARTVTVESVERDGTGEIVESGGSVDPRTCKVTSTVTWQIDPGRNGTSSEITFLVDPLP